MKASEAMNDWLVLERMLEAWLEAGNARSFKERQTLIPTMNYIFDHISIHERDGSVVQPQQTQEKAVESEQSEKETCATKENKQWVTQA